MNSALGCHEPQPICGSYLAITPVGGDRQFPVRGYNPGIGNIEGLRADEVLVHLGQAALPQSGEILSDEWLQTYIAGLRDQNGTEAGLKPFGLSRSVAKMGEGLGKPSTVHHFKQNVREAALGRNVETGP